MKLIERECADVKVLPIQSAKTDASPRPTFEVDFRISSIEESGGVKLAHHIAVSTSILPNGAFADRQWVEAAAARQLPALLRDTADELERLMGKGDLVP